MDEIQRKVAAIVAAIMAAEGAGLLHGHTRVDLDNIAFSLDQPILPPNQHVPHGDHGPIDLRAALTVVTSASGFSASWTVASLVSCLPPPLSVGCAQPPR
jgi:hypothetical protein